MTISGLTNEQKIKLLNELYEDLAGRGINGDTELAHVNKHEAAVLKAMGGSGTINKDTGLRQYDLFGGDDPEPQPAPSSTTVRQVSDLPEYFKPYAEKLLATAEQVYDQPYVPYEGERLAAPTAAQETALRGIESMFTGPDGEFQAPGQARLEQAYGMAEQAGQRFADLAPGEFASTYMSPYQQAVTDIQKREAEKQAEQQRQQLSSQAAQTGAFGGSRAALQDMLQREQESRLLSDIQKQGLQSAYETGLQTFDADRQAQRAAATQYGQLAGQEQSQALTGLGALQTAGETQRALAQQPLDIQYEEFARQQQAPRQSLQEMSGILRGVPVTPSTYQTTQQFQQAPGLGQQLLTAGSVAAGISSGLGKSFFGGAKAQGGLVGLACGGEVDKHKYERGGSVRPPSVRPPGTSPYSFKGADEIAKRRLMHNRDMLGMLLEFFTSDEEKKPSSSVRPPDGKTPEHPEAAPYVDQKSLDEKRARLNKGPQVLLGGKPAPSQDPGLSSTIKKEQSNTEGKGRKESFKPRTMPGDAGDMAGEALPEDFYSPSADRTNDILNHPIIQKGIKNLKEDWEEVFGEGSDNGDDDLGDFDFAFLPTSDEVEDMDFTPTKSKPTAKPKDSTSVAKGGTDPSVKKDTDPVSKKESDPVIVGGEDTWFDMDAAMPWLMMAAKTSQPGQTFGQALEGGLGNFEKARQILHSRAKDAEEMGLKKEAIQLKREAAEVDKKYKEAYGTYLKTLGDNAVTKSQINKAKNNIAYRKNLVDTLEVQSKNLTEELKNLNFMGGSGDVERKQQITKALNIINSELAALYNMDASRMGLGMTPSEGSARYTPGSKK